jgi:hypothetical protein
VLLGPHLEDLCNSPFFADAGCKGPGKRVSEKLGTADSEDFSCGATVMYQMPEDHEDRRVY